MNEVSLVRIVQRSTLAEIKGGIMDHGRESQGGVIVEGGLFGE